LARTGWEGFYTHGETKLEFWTKLEAQLYSKGSKIERQYIFKVTLNNYQMILNKKKVWELN